MAEGEAVPKDENKQEEQVDYKDRLMRLAAEFDNYKKRTRTDVANAKTLGKAELMKEMLPVLDEFEIALVAMRGSSADNFVKGFELLYSNFKDSLKKAGLEDVKAVGIYDPYKHEIMMTQESDKKPGTILEVTKRGYTIGEILLRPASVIVAKAKEEKKIDDKQQTK